MMWQAKLKAWAVGLGVTAAAIGGTGYLATTGVGQGPPVPGAGPRATPTTRKVETPAAVPAGAPVTPAAKGDPEDVEALQFDIERAVLQIQRAVFTINQEKMINAAPRGTISPAELTAAAIAGLQAKEDMLVAMRNMQLAKRKLAALKGQPVAVAVPMTAELRKLREQRVEALALAMKYEGNRRSGGLFSDQDIVAYLDLSKELVEAEMALASTGEHKSALWVKHRDRLREFRIDAEGRAKSGTMKESSALQARAAELAAEIRLLELGAK